MDKYSVTWKIKMRINFNQQPCVCVCVCVCVYEKERKRFILNCEKLNIFALVSEVICLFVCSAT